MFLNNLFKYWTYQIFAPGTVLRNKYEAFKKLLEADKRAHDLMAQIEEVYYSRRKVDISFIETTYAALSEEVAKMISCLNQMAPLEHLDLKDYYKKIDFYIRFILAPPDYDFSPPFTLKFTELPEDCHHIAGGKGESISRIVKKTGLPVPKGFVITTGAFYYFLEFNGLRDEIKGLLAELDITSPESVDSVSKRLTALVQEAQVPPDIEQEILSCHDSIWNDNGKNIFLAVRSSAVGEDTSYSFAGQHLSLLNVTRDTLTDAYKKVLSSKYMPAPLCYRIHHGLADMEAPMAVVVQELVEARSSGVIYTRSIEEERDDIITIHSIWGLGELLVGGEISPDTILISKKDRRTLIDQKIAPKPHKAVLTQEGETRLVPNRDEEKNRSSIPLEKAFILADWSFRLEDFFGAPQDIEWCEDRDGNLFVLQSRPLYSLKKSAPSNFSRTPNKIQAPLLISGGETAARGTGMGRVFILNKDSDLKKIPERAVLVAKNGCPHYVAALDRISCLITDYGSTAGHLASVAREYGVPYLANTKVATSVLKPDSEVTVLADEKRVYDGYIDPDGMLTESLKEPDENNPLLQTVKSILKLISPLRLIDPTSHEFAASGCRSLHDIIRFVHEKGVSTMFFLSDKGSGSARGAKKLVSQVPILFYVLDVGGGLKKKAREKKEITPGDIACLPMKALWKGLTDTSIRWSGIHHFDWEDYDNIMLSGGIIKKDAPSLASYAVLSSDYLNINIRFGYHFIIIDAICSQSAADSHILFRFTGGGGDLKGRSLRAEFIRRVLDHSGFNVEVKGDLIDGQLKNEPLDTLEKQLSMLGRLLGATRLMDMYLDNQTKLEEMVEKFIEKKGTMGPEI